MNGLHDKIDDCRQMHKQEMIYSSFEGWPHNKNVVSRSGVTIPMPHPSTGILSPVPAPTAPGIPPDKDAGLFVISYLAWGGCVGGLSGMPYMYN